MLADVAKVGKVCSERFAKAKMDGKWTAGEAAKEARKRGFQLSAKELVKAYTDLFGREPEWHHAGFYKGAGGHQMGRTFFFSQETLSDLIEKLPTLETVRAEALAKKAAEEKAQKESMVKGFYWYWKSDYKGNYGKKRNFKVLGTYEGSFFSAPNNFSALEDAMHEVDGLNYFPYRFILTFFSSIHFS